MSPDPRMGSNAVDLASLADFRDASRWLVTTLGLGSGLLIGLTPAATVLAATKVQHVTPARHLMVVIGIAVAAGGALAAAWAASRVMTPSLTTWRSLGLKECVGLRERCRDEPEAFFGTLAKDPDELRKRRIYHQSARANMARLQPANDQEVEAVQIAMSAADSTIALYTDAEANFLRLIHLWIVRQRLLTARRWALAGGAAAVLGSTLAALAFLP
jgi:hypothetical protein